MVVLVAESPLPSLLKGAVNISIRATFINSDKASYAGLDIIGVVMVEDSDTEALKKDVNRRIRSRVGV